MEVGRRAGVLVALMGWKVARKLILAFRHLVTRKACPLIIQFMEILFVSLSYWVRLPEKMLYSEKE